MSSDDLSGLVSKPVEIEKPEVLTKSNAQRLLGGLPIQTVSEMTSKGSTFLIYGDFGIGKTPLVGSASEVPEMSPLLYLDFEKGLRSIKNTYPDVDVIALANKPNPGYKGTDRAGTIKSYAWDQFQAVYDSLYNKNPGYKTIGIDTLSEAYKLGMVQLMNNTVDSKSNMDDPEVPSPREYGIMLERMRLMVRGFKELGVNLICTAHAAEVTVKKTGAVKIQPAFPGQVATTLPVFFDFVFYYDMVEEKKGDKVQQVRYIRTQKTTKIAARARQDQSNPLPAIIREPTMPKIFELINKT